MLSLLAAVPTPPIHFKASSFQNVFSVAQMVLAAAMFIYAFRELARGKGPIMLWCLIGGAIAVIWEPIVDVLGQCWLPSRGQHWEAFTLLNRHIPLMMPFVYSWYVGGEAYLFYRLFQKGIKRERLFGLWALVLFVDICLETPGIATHVYTYYGKQPFNFWGFPLWWGFINPLMPMIAGAFVYKMKPYLTQWWMLGAATIVFIPSADGVANAFAGWPVIAALNTDVGWIGSWVGGFICLGLSLLAVYMVSIAVQHPAEAKEPLPEPAAAPAPVPAGASAAPTPVVV